MKNILKSGLLLFIIGKTINIPAVLTSPTPPAKAVHQQNKPHHRTHRYSHKRSHENAQTLLLEASQKGDLEGIKKFIGHEGTDKDEALYTAVEHNHPAAVRYLLDQGASTLDFQDLFRKAIDKDDTNASKIAEMLILSDPRSTIKMRDIYGNTPLQHAAYNHNESLLTLLIDLGSDVNARNKGGYTALIMSCLETDITKASQENNTIISRHLLAAGADVNQPGPNDDAPLHWAIYYKSADHVALLIAHGANINAKNKDGLTAVMVAAATRNNSEIVKLLLDAGAELSHAVASSYWMEEAHGYTALELAKNVAKDQKMAALIEKALG